MLSIRKLAALLAFSITSVAAVGVGDRCNDTWLICDAGLVCVKNILISRCEVAPVVTTTASSTTTTAPVPSGTPAPNIPAGVLTAITNFGTNPTNIGMFVYKPASVQSNPGLLVALHYCGGTAADYFSGNQFKTLADQRGFMVLYGQAPNDNNCWDVTSTASLTHDGGSDSLGIASAVRYALANWNINPDKVFVAGTSSGSFMTNVLAAAYPDLFKAGAVFAGTPVGCLSANAPSFPSDSCAAGRVSKTAAQWGDIARNAYPGYTGARPKMQIWHGTSDLIIDYDNFEEQIKQWTNVFGLSVTPSSTTYGDPSSDWTKTTYGSAGQLVAYSGDGLGHSLPQDGTEVVAINFFGL